MITMTAKRGKRLLATLLTVAAAWALGPYAGMAQDPDRREVTVKVENGKILVNGEEVSPDDDGRIVLKDEDGEDVVVYVRKRGDRHAVWVDSDDEDSPRMFSFGRNGSGVWSLEDDEDADGTVERRFRLRSGDPSIFDDDFNVYFDGAPRLRAEMKKLQARRERAPMLAENAREMAERAREMAENQAQYRQYFGVLRDDMPFMGMMRQRQSDELRELENEIRKVAGEARRAEGAERTELEARLDQMLSEAFEMKQAEAEESARDLTERLDEMKQRQSERAAARREIIENRKRQLLGERSMLDW